MCAAFGLFHFVSTLAFMTSANALDPLKVMNTAKLIGYVGISGHSG